VLPIGASGKSGVQSMNHIAHHEVQAARRALDLGLPANPQVLAYILETGDTDNARDLFERTDELEGERECMKIAERAADGIRQECNYVDDVLAEVRLYLASAARVDRDKLRDWLDAIANHVDDARDGSDCVVQQCSTS
jgi:hypothetical protein